MTSTITTIKKGMVTIPPNLQRKWRNRKVCITGDGAALIIKPVPAPSNARFSLTDIAKEFRAAFRKTGQHMSARDIAAEIRLVRKKRYGTTRHARGY